MSVIQASIPLFFLLIGIELLVARARGNRTYRLNDSVADLSLGILSQIADIGIKLATLGIYAWVAAHWSAQRLGAPGWVDGSPFVGPATLGIDWLALASWMAVFVLVDFLYYWTHRLSHRVNILWAGHVVHHSSEEYNLTVALRQSALHGLFTWVFYLPLALVGVPPRMFVTAYALNLIYQFWIHTREIGKLSAPVELVMNTPSHHRVHHGVNPKYQDRNYAGVFIIWDRMFGSFQPEEEEPVYGITKPLASWSPLWANVHVFAEIARGVRRVRRWGDRMRIVFGPPGWRPAELGGPIVPREVAPSTYAKFDPPVPRTMRRYALVQFIVVLLATIKVLELAAVLPTHQTAALAFYVVLSITNIGGLLEGRGWAFSMELARQLTLAATAAALGALGMVPVFGALAAAGFCGGSALWVLRLRAEPVRESEPGASSGAEPVAPRS
ncbi:MAG TPA: sterol desaturase family protein [Gemmatimonadaceae bacterium]|nr:sterol desaturase family protein [Gemmatimonadaceae bacterium]